MTCKEVLLEYLQNHEGTQKKVDLYAVAEDWSPETVGRDLRLLEEEGKIFVSYYKGKYCKKDLAQYSTNKPIKKKQVVTFIDDKVHIEYI